MQRDDVFVSVDWLHYRLEHPDVIPVDASWYLPTMLKDGEPRNARAEFEAGHIPGAVFFDLDALSDQKTDLPHMMPSPVAFSSAMRAMGLSNAHTLVVYDGLGLFSAPRIWWMLRSFGAEHVFILDGGMPAWIEAGYELADVEKTRPHSHFIAQLDSSAIANFSDVHAASKSGDATLVDARPADRFDGSQPEPRPGLTAGHIPGARSIPFTELQSDGRMLTAEALGALFKQKAVATDKPLITSCGSGVTAVTAALGLMLAGARDVRIYDGSWAEWGANPEHPVETGPDRG